MPTYFVVYRQPFLYKHKDGERISWGRDITSRDALDDTQAESWKNEFLDAKSVSFNGKLYKRRLIRFAQQNGADSRILEGT